MLNRTSCAVAGRSLFTVISTCVFIDYVCFGWPFVCFYCVSSIIIIIIIIWDAPASSTFVDGERHWARDSLRHYLHLYFWKFEMTHSLFIPEPRRGALSPLFFLLSRNRKSQKHKANNSVLIYENPAETLWNWYQKRNRDCRRWSLRFLHFAPFKSVWGIFFRGWHGGALINSVNS